MKQLFLTSSIGTEGVAKSVYQKLNVRNSLKTAFIITPVEPEKGDLSWVEEDRNGLNAAGFTTFDYTITGKTEEQINNDLADIDVLYVSGGNTNHLLEQSQKTNFIKFVHEFVQAGKPYVSTSAGSIIAGPTLPPYLWGDHQASPSVSDFTAYRLVNFTVIPHWGSPYFRDLYLQGRMEQVYQETAQPFIVINDHEYVEVIDDRYRIVDVRVKT